MNTHDTMKRFFSLALLTLLVTMSLAAQPGRSRASSRHHRGGMGHRYERFETSSHHTPLRWRWHNDNNYYGFRLGLNGAHVRSDAVSLDGNQFKAGLNVGVVAGFGLSYTTPLYFETGLYYSQKGGESDNGSKGSKFTYDLNYLEVPLLLKYRHYVSRDVTIEPFAGAFVAAGVGGNIKNYGAREAFSSYDDGYFRRMDAGIKLGCGIGFNVGYLDLSYDIGLANVGQDTFDNSHTGCLTINIGVNF